MLDLKLFRENPNIIKASEKKRGRDTKSVDEVIKLDKKWRDLVQDSEKLKHRRNIVTQKISELKKSGKSAEKELKEMKEVAQKIAEIEQKAKLVENERDEIRYRIGNILHESVPEGMDAEVVRTWGKIPKYDFKLKSHIDLLESLNLGDLERAAKIAGARFKNLRFKPLLEMVVCQSTC